MASGDPYKQYVQVVQQSVAARRPIDWDFKSDKAYRVILEHVTREQARDYVAAIRAEFGTVWRRNRGLFRALVLANDRYGAPRRHRFSWRLPKCSPTNARYLYHALLALRFLGRGPVADVVEIGGGYGGLCHFVHGLAPAMDVALRSYTILDLPEVAALQARYLSVLGHTQVRTSHLDDPALATVLAPDAVLLSNYALGELSRPLQQRYRELVIEPYVSHAFVIWNAPETYPRFFPGEPVPRAQECFPGMQIREEPERPDLYEGTRFVYAHRAEA